MVTNARTCDLTFRYDGGRSKATNRLRILEGLLVKENAIEVPPIPNTHFKVFAIATASSEVGTYEQDLPVAIVIIITFALDDNGWTMKITSAAKHAIYTGKLFEKLLSV